MHFYLIIISLCLLNLLNASSKIAIFISYVQRNTQYPELLASWLGSHRLPFHGLRWYSFKYFNFDKP